MASSSSISFSRLFSLNKERPSPHSVGSSKKEEPGNKTFRCFILLTGKTLNSHNGLMDRLQKRIPNLQVVHTVGECDIILVFCPVIRGPAPDIKAALEKLNHISDTRPAVLVVLHHTFNPECVVPDSSRAVNRENMITVDCLFHEDQGLLPCQKNEDSLARIIKYVKPQSKKEKTNMEQMKRKHAVPAKKATLKYFILLTGHTLNIHEFFIAQLKYEIPQLQEVCTVDRCDFILAFCPVVSRAGTDIETALKKLNHVSAVKPAVLVVLHRTFDPECVVPDSSRAVNRGNTITVDHLFHENLGLLQCQKNHESFTRIINYIKPQIQPVLSIEDRMETEQTCMLSTRKTHKYFIYQMGNTPNSHKAFMDSLEQMSDLQKVETENECDFILTFYPVVYRDGTDIKKALKKLESISDTKPVVLVKNHGNFVPECVVPDSTRSVNRENTLLEAQESMQSSDILARGTKHIQSQCDREQCENMEEQAAEGPSQCTFMLKETEPSKNQPKTMEIELQNKDQQLEMMRTELEKLKAELAEKNKQLEKKEILPSEGERPEMERHMQVEEEDRVLRKITQKETKLREVKVELENTVKNLQEKKKQLAIVSKLLSEGIDMVEKSKITLDSLGKEMQEKNRQIQEMMI